jgi:MFS family permease
MLGEEERSKANGVMWAAKYAGVMAGGGGLAMIASALGWRWLFLVMAALMFTIAILPALAREPCARAAREA